MDLNRRGSQHEDVRSLALSPAIEVEEDLNVFLVDERGELGRIETLRHLDELVTTRFNGASRLAVV